MAQEAEQGTVGMNECDTNADTCCLGVNWKVLESFGVYFLHGRCIFV